MSRDAESSQNSIIPECDIGWISDEWERRTTIKRSERKNFEVTLRQILLKLLKKANKLNSNLSKFLIFGKKGGKIEVADNWWRQMLKRRTPGNYIFRLVFNQTTFSKFEAFEIHHSHSSNASKDKDRAVIKFHHALIMEEKQRLRNLLKPCIEEGSDIIVPEKICSWLVPALKKAAHKMKSTVLKGCKIAIVTAHTKQGFFMTLTSSSSDQAEATSRTVHIEFQLAVPAHNLPKSFKIPNPYGSDSFDHKKGRRLASDIRKAFAQEKLSFMLYSAMPHIVRMPKIETGRTPRLHRLLLDTADEDGCESDKTWAMDLENLEQALYKGIKAEANAQLCLQSLRLYDALTCIDSHSMPRLNKRTKLSIVLWIFKKHGHRRHMSNKTMLLRVLRFLDICVKHLFFPSFVRPAVSTMLFTKTSQRESSLVDTDAEDTDDEEIDGSIKSNAEETADIPGSDVENSMGSSSRTKSSDNTTDWLSWLYTDILQRRSFLSVIIELVKNDQNSLLMELFKLSNTEARSS